MRNNTFEQNIEQATRVCFDNNVVRALLGNPEKWDGFYDQMHPKLGVDIDCIQSYGLFFEYIGLKDFLTTPCSNMFKFDQSKISIDKIGNFIELYFEKAQEDIFKELLIKQSIIIEYKDKQFLYEPKCDINKNVRKALFYDVFCLMKVDYNEFAKIVAHYFAWDFFCNLALESMSKDKFRKYQLDIWVQYYEQGIVLPIGKIIDDIDNVAAKYQKNSLFHSSGDLVDSEAITYVLVGCNNQNKYEIVHFITLDDPKVIEDRIAFIVNAFEVYGLQAKVKYCLGIIHCLNKSMEIQKSISVRV